MQLMHLRQIRGWLLRLFGLFHRKQDDQEFADELESHLALHLADNLRAGMLREEARRQAHLKLGGMTPTQELYREQRGIPMLETLLWFSTVGLFQRKRRGGKKLFLSQRKPNSVSSSY